MLSNWYGKATQSSLCSSWDIYYNSTISFPIQNHFARRSFALAGPIRMVTIWDVMPTSVRSLAMIGSTGSYPYLPGMHRTHIHTNTPTHFSVSSLCHTIFLYVLHTLKNSQALLFSLLLFLCVFVLFSFLIFHAFRFFELPFSHTNFGKLKACRAKKKIYKLWMCFDCTLS